ncbi:MAG: Uncharacterised protein family UPF0066 [Candidatus Kentron sp. G]|nr:MAG: Uncharacterised protein family UPF0066 [Candidatus Kentron sp. G]VFM97476.1 MAG: Uncharacterised protein family UPF0066 [Candidatus Kentron sp. G]VFM99799.1 MAG: Uncharacterised protein family UPF0066 [Candidatus Kentron sp. G]
MRLLLRLESGQNDRAIRYILFWQSPYRLEVVPYLDGHPRGLFATRAPSRPNAIGLSVVRLLGIEDNRLAVADLDLLDGTPVLDIKPYVGEFDHRTHTRMGWLEAARKRERSSDSRFV